jgi:hypothetical protein
MTYNKEKNMTDINIEGNHFQVPQQHLVNALENIQVEIWETAERSGWHERERELPEVLALCHSELSEALEAWRDGMDLTEVKYQYCAEGGTPYLLDTPTAIVDGVEVLGKPEGVASELADTIIRILDVSEEEKIPTARLVLEKMRFNRTRSYRHGGKRA